MEHDLLKSRKVNSHRYKSKVSMLELTLLAAYCLRRRKAYAKREKTETKSYQTQTEKPLSSL
jgi:signal transduction histidine kinase